MNIKRALIGFALLSAILFASGCSTAKLEARLEANPQCKDVVNPKTGALMPCPGSDKAFYREVGLAPPKPVPEVNLQASSAQKILSGLSTTQMSSNLPSPPAQLECKPQIHKKTGGTLPCPTPD